MEPGGGDQFSCQVGTVYTVQYYSHIGAIKPVYLNLFKPVVLLCEWWVKFVTQAENSDTGLDLNQVEINLPDDPI